MPRIVKTGWEQQVRDELGADESYVPDSFLQQPTLIDLAEANVMKVIPGWETIPDSERVFLETAVVCECAALACPSMPARLPRKETGPHASYELDIDWFELQKSLQVKRDACLAGIVEAASIPFFSVTGPGR
jgi:hypothetical protein